ncbi:OLC1v1034846C1 [Oldenlandia corymbosa var. corymbosa]|uniref:OLC1v1034846C1 n=1 Tax=Oldenlandia corymbosa var. corymbosa TaxID=529605 RepID=A0AAV1CTB1_OLDCO|nr:OLC1v1034846C1 [Oldenlandia corymbosa var. corymbosa]
MTTNGRLEVLLLEAEGIKDRDKCLVGCLNWVNPCRLAAKPYVRIQYENQEHTSSVGKGRGEKRQWNEKFTFDVNYPAGDGREDHVYKLVLHIMDKHKYNQDEPVGQTTVYIKDILSLGAEKGKLEVEPRVYRIVESDKSYTGQISIALTFLKGEDETQGDIGGWKESDVQE